MHPEFAEFAEQTAVVEWIGISPVRRAEIQVRAEIEVDQDGIVGDYHAKRKVSLIQREHLHVISGLLGGREVEPQQLRRNLLVSGINLQALIGLEFSIGQVHFRGADSCPPCQLMEQNLGRGGYLAMVGHGGIVADVVKAGRIKIGDPIQVLGSI